VAGGDSWKDCIHPISDHSPRASRCRCRSRPIANIGTCPG
jgi:hypothetical protein